MRSAIVALAMVISFTTGFHAVRWHTTSKSFTGTPMRSGVVAAIAESPQGGVVDELMLIYIGSSSCGWSNAPDLAPAVRIVIDSIAERASREGSFLTTVGVDLAAVRGRELDHLRELTDFHQISIGGSFLNWIGAEATWGALGGPAATPQLMIIRRQVTKRSARGEMIDLVFGPPVIITRKVGLEEIVVWAEDGVVTPPA